MEAFRPLRSILFAPGNRQRLLEKVGSQGADAVVIDLEDAVPIEDKVATRGIVCAALESFRWPRAFVRVNPVESRTDFSVASGLEDVEAVASVHLSGIVLPKVEGADEVVAVARILDTAEERQELPVGRIEIMPLIETARGVQQAAAVAAAHPRVRRLAFGAGDFTTDIGVEWSSDGLAYLVARSQLVIASRAAGREQPIDTAFPGIEDTAGLQAETHTALRLGFQGKFAIHPDQVPIINTVFTPGAARVAEARRWIAEFDAAVLQRRAAVRVDGKLLDYANVAQLRRLVATAEALGLE